MNKDLIWYGPPFSYSGYAQHNRAMLFELQRLGWNIFLTPTEEHIPSGLAGKDLLTAMVNKPGCDTKKTISLNLIPPPSMPFYSAYTILFTTIESLTVHEGFLSRICQFDEVWVPCQANFNSLLKAGYPKKKLFVVPEGVYTENFKPFVAPMPEYTSDKFTFFYHGDWSFRKGVDILIRAYAKAFSRTDNVRLIMLTHYQGGDSKLSKTIIPMEVRFICKKYGLTELPKIEFIFDYIEDADLPSLYSCTDVYVAPTRGEAWGLPICQAMSCGKPAIVTGWGGQLDFCNNKNGFICDIDKFDIMDDKCQLNVDFYKLQKFPFCDVDHFAELMRYCYENREVVKEKGKKARKTIEESFTWANAAKIADRRLRAIYESNTYNANVQSSKLDERIDKDVIKGFASRYL